MMDIVKNRGFIGLTYQTSKKADWKALSEYKKEPNTNYCFFVPCDLNQSYNTEFLNKFYYDIWNYNMELVDFDKYLSILEEYKNILKQQNKVYNMSDYYMYSIIIDSHIKKCVIAMEKIFMNLKK